MKFTPKPTHMKHELTTTTESRRSVLYNLGAKYNVEPAKLLETLKQTAFRGANDSQMMALCIVADQFNLNPFTREIYAFPDKAGGIVPVVGVDGWLRRMNEHPQFDGIEFEFHPEHGEGKPESCTCTIYRKDREHPTVVTEYYAECHRNTDPWNRSPRRMLRHRVLIQCARIAFGFGGTDPDESEAASMRDVTPQEVRHPASGNPFVNSAPRLESPQPERKRGRPRKVAEPPPARDLELEEVADDDPTLPAPEPDAKDDKVPMDW